MPINNTICRIKIICINYYHDNWVLFILFIYKQYLYRLSNSAQAGLTGGLFIRFAVSLFVYFVLVCLAVRGRSLIKEVTK